MEHTMDSLEQLALRDIPGGVVVPVKVVPGASRDRVVGVLGGSLKVATSAAAEKGRANAAVAKLLAVALHVDARSVELVAGAAAPRKEFRVTGLSASEVVQRLGAKP